MLTPNESATTHAFETYHTDRRKVIATLGTAGLGLLASTGQASAFIFRRKNDQPKVTVQAGGNARGADADLSAFPAEWVRLQGRALPEYARYIQNLRLRTISTEQVIEAHAKAKGPVWNSLPPKAWWNRMGYTLRVVDRIGIEMNQPVREIISAYRSPAYNARCAGAKRGSWHQANVALDVRFHSRPSQVTSTARHMRDRGLFKGGVGGYGSFTHIDTRGQNTNW
jgi:hypothetical protein